MGVYVEEAGNLSRVPRVDDRPASPPAALALIEERARAHGFDAMCDAGVGALLGLACVRGACFNVRINLKAIDDESFAEDWHRKARALYTDAQAVHDRALAHMERNL